MDDKKFDSYMHKQLDEYLCRLKRHPATDENIFLYQVSKLIDVWKENFYDETNRRMGSVHHEDHFDVAQDITDIWMQNKSQVEYVDNRITISRDDLFEICLDIVDNFYVKAHDIVQP